MSITKLYDLAVVTHKYTTNGQEKSNWLNIGTLFQGDNNYFIMMKAHFNPAGIARKEGVESILVSLFAPKDSNNDYNSFCWTTFSGSKLYDLCVGTRKYTKDGEEKTAWENVGVIIMGDKNPYLMLKAHFNPAAIARKEGSESIVISLFKPNDKNLHQASNNSAPQDYYSSSDSFNNSDNADNFTPIDDRTGFSYQPDPNGIPF